MIAVVPSGWRMDFAVFSDSVEDAVCRFVAFYGFPPQLAVFDVCDQVKFNSYIYKKTLSKHKILSFLNSKTSKT